MSDQFPQYPDNANVVLSGRMYNRIVQWLARLQNMIGVSPITVDVDDSGIRIGTASSKTSRWLQLTDTYAGTGRYKAKPVTGWPQNVDTSTDLALPDNGESIDMDSPEVCWENSAESHNATGTHALAVDGTVIVRGHWEGGSSDSTPVNIYRGTAGGGSPILYGKVSAIWTAALGYITLTPSDATGTPTGASDIHVSPEQGTAAYCGYELGAIVTYRLTPAATLDKNIMPKATAQWQVFVNQGTPPTLNYLFDQVRVI